MRVVAFTKTGRRGPSSRYRFEALRGPLRDLGVRLETEPLFLDAWFVLLRVRPRILRVGLKAVYAGWRFAVRGARLGRVRDADLVVVEHQLFPYLPAWGERWLSRRRTPWQLEFDDAIHLTRLHARKMALLCRLADRVVVGNDTLARFARRHARAAAVEVVPTLVDADRIRPRAPSPPGRPAVIGWIGLPTNFGALRLLAAPLRRLAATTPIVLRVVSDGAPQLEGVPVEARPWSEEGEADEVRGFDVGVMPLPDDAWSRGKCGLKILQAFAAGVPVVASPVGVNAELIRPGENGLLATSDEEWHDALALLLRDGALRRRLAEAGRRTVEERYSLPRWAPRIAAGLKGAAASRS
ncbi:MAG: glycosyltransferase family 4 protein [Planctomycetota bacterium JB042]